MTTTTKQEAFITELRLTAIALQKAIPTMDELNGRLYELTHEYEHEVNRLPEHDEQLILEAKEMFMNLPVWSTMTDVANGLVDLVNDLEAKQGEGKQ